LTPEEEYLTAKVDSIQWRIWSELRKQPVLTCVLVCAHLGNRQSEVYMR